MENEIERISDNGRVVDLNDDDVLKRIITRLGHEHDNEGNCLIPDYAEKTMSEILKRLAADERMGEYVSKSYMIMSMKANAAIFEGGIENGRKTVMAELLEIFAEGMMAGYLEGLTVGADEAIKDLRA